MSAKNPDRLAREQAMTRTDSDADQILTPEGQEPCTDYNGMALEEWKVAVSADLEDHFGPVPSDLVPVGEAGW